MLNASILSKIKLFAPSVAGSHLKMVDASVLDTQRYKKHQHSESYAELSIIYKTASGLPPSVTFLIAREIKKTIGFAELPNDWDSYGALPTQPLAIRQAVGLLQNPSFVQLLPIENPRVAAFPLASGGIQLDLNGGIVPMEIEISANGEMEFAFFGPTNEVLWEGYSLYEAIEWYGSFSNL